MTADAKVGLLLGLVFIVIIAFVVNGLPDFVQSFKKDAVVETAVTTQMPGNLVIDPAAMDVARGLQRGQGMRYSQPPGEVMVLDELDAARPRVDISAEQAVISPVEKPVLAMLPSELSKPVAGPAEQQALPVQTAKGSVNTHLVQKGETLAIIAKRYYGPEEGDRLATIQRLYQVNKGVLDSPDKVRVGDRLIIPVVKGLEKVSNQPAKKESAAAALMDKFKGVFEQVRQEKSSSISEYTVRSGEHLWGIAEKQLGDGHRYGEIIKLNGGKISDADDIQAGMRLRMPKR